MTDESIPSDQDHLGDNSGAMPAKGRPKRSSTLRVSLIVAVLVGVLMLVFWLVASSAKPEGPTLKSQLQEQQRAFDQLSEEMNSLQQHRDTQSLAQSKLKDQLDALLQRIEQLETLRQKSQHESLPDQIEALSTRVDELSASTDVRFSAVFEKQKAFEGALEAADEDATSEPAEASAKPTTVQRPPTPPSPPFTITGLERRGGRSYLAVASGSIHSLNDIRLISEGERLGRWQLTSIDGQSALFSVNGQRVVVPAP